MTKARETDPAELWERYCEETPVARRTPQGAMAFAFDALTPAIQPQRIPSREEMASIVYEGAHKGLKNCWKWTDDGLDAEHPGRRGYYYKIADAVLAALSLTRPKLCPTEKIEDGQS